MNPSCDVCALLKKDGDVVISSRYWRVVLARDQGYLGRSFITLKSHKSHLSELGEDEWLDYADIVNKIETTYKKALGATNFNWACLMNNAYQQQDPTPHIHWHMRPRYQNSVVINGNEFIDADFGYHYDREHRKLVDNATFVAILDKLQTPQNN